MMMFELIAALDKAIAQRLPGDRITILDVKVAKEILQRLRDVEEEALQRIENYGREAKDKEAGK